jgi:cytochrome c oxidase subunit III
MATYTPSTPIQGTGHDGNPPIPPSGGGDDSRGGQGPNYSARLRRARLGLICAMATVSMVFISLTSAYIVRKGLPTFDDASSTYVRDWGEVHLPWLLLGLNTVILLVSSVTMELSRRDLARQAALAPVRSIPGVSLGDERHFPWLGATVILGLGFLLGQWLAWKELENRGFYVNTNPDSSFVYLLTATHGIHLAGGILALTWAAIAALRKREIESRRIIVEITSWYWHFMALLWIYVFALLGFAK